MFLKEGGKIEKFSKLKKCLSMCIEDIVVGHKSFKKMKFCTKLIFCTAFVLSIFLLAEITKGSETFEEFEKARLEQVKKCSKI